jgi:hypothetical protein
MELSVQRIEKYSYTVSADGFTVSVTRTGPSHQPWETNVLGNLYGKVSGATLEQAAERAIRQLQAAVKEAKRRQAEGARIQELVDKHGWKV